MKLKTALQAALIGAYIAYAAYLCANDTSEALKCWRGSIEEQFAACEVQ